MDNGQTNDAPGRKPGAPVHRNELDHWLHAFRYSGDGLRAAWTEEPSVKQIIAAAILFVPLALYLGEGWAEKAVLALPSFLSLIIELVNSAIENVVDYISLERHPLAKKAKDMGSAAQLIGLVFYALVWGAFAWEKLL